MSVINSKWMDAVDWNSITNKNTIQLLAGEDLADRDIAIVAMAGNTSSLTAGRIYKADIDVADRSTKVFLSGVVLGAVSSGETATLQIFGVVSGFSSLTAGQPYYMSSTAGSYSSTGSKPYLIGGAVSTTEIFVFQKTRRIWKTAEYTSSQDITMPTDIIWIWMCGGGAGGGTGSSSPHTGGGGGGGGYYVENYPVSVSPGEVVTYTQGAGGNAGNSGGTSTFAADSGSISCPGGTPGGNGQGSPVYEGAGGIGGTSGGNGGVDADENNSASPGQGKGLYSGGSVTSAIGPHGGGGGAGLFGNGANGGKVAVGSSASANTGAGGGGGGGNYAGGSGGSGKLIVGWWEEF